MALWQGWPWDGHTENVLSVAVFPNNERVVSGSEDMTVRIWNILTGRPLKTLKVSPLLVTISTLYPSYLFMANAYIDQSLNSSLNFNTKYVQPSSLT